MARRYPLAFVLGLMLAAAATAPASAQTPAPAPAQTPAPAPAPNAGPVYVLTFFEVGAAPASQAIGFLRPFATATRKEDGNQGFLALQEIARPARFAMVEIWRDKSAAEAHAASVGALRDKLQPLFASPFDIRSNSGLLVAGPAIGAEPEAGRPVYVLTHVDVFPAGKDQTIDMLKQLAEASRKEPGNLMFDVLQQEGRANHLPLVEVWRDAKAQSAHAMAEHTRAFRAKLVPLQGALYDERLYTVIR
jgi:quinol monooxygenase YgiN